MNYRSFGNESLEVSEVGLGAWQLGSDCWGDLDKTTANAILNSALSEGVNFFDTADVYGEGLSELRIGKFLKSTREKIFVATKLGRFPDPGDKKNFSRKTFTQHTENSLKRLGVEALDLTQLHCIPPDLLKQGEVFEWLNDLKREGKILRFGASVESMDEALICLEQEGLSSLQIIFNVFRQKPISTLFQKAKEKGIALIVRLPLASGLLAGKMTRETRFPENDHRNFNRDGASFNVGETFAGIPFEKGLGLSEELKNYLPEGWTLAQMALRWILDFDAVTTIIPGCKSPDQARQNVHPSDLPPLSPELHRKLKEFYETRVSQNIRGPY